MKPKILNLKYYSALKISLIYLVVSSLYIIFSDRIILIFLGNTVPANLLSNVQSYKGLVFVLITSTLIFGFIQREINSKRKYILDLESKKKKLEDSELKFRTLFESMALGVTYQNRDGEIIDANKAAQKILGLTFDQMQGITSVDPSWNCIHEDGSHFPGETHASMVALKTGKSVNGVTMGVFNPIDKEYRWIKIDAIPQFLKDESAPFQVFTTFDDITVERRVQQSLNELYSKYQNIIHTANIAIAELDNDGSYTFVNPAWEEMFGYSSSEALGKNTGLLMPSDETDHSLFNKLKNGQVTDYQQERKYRAKNGKIIWCDLYVAANNDLEGNLKSIVGVMIDITEAKKFELSLKENEYRYVKAQKLGKVGNWEYNLQTTHFWGSEETRRIFGFEPDDDDFATEFVESCIPERERVHQALVDLIEKGKEYNLEYRVNPKNGDSPRIVNSIAQLQLDEKGQPLKVMGVILEVTRQKQIEESIRQSESILAASQKMARVGGWQWDVEKQKIFWTDETYQIHEFEKTSFEMGSEAHINESLKCYEDEDREKIALAFNNCIKNGEGYEFIVPFTTAKGKKLWIQTSAKAIVESGKVKKVTGVIQDITESKIAQEGLRLSEAHFRSLMENVQGFVLYRLHKNINNNRVSVQLVSPSIRQMLGATDPDNLNEWFANIHPDDLERVAEANSISIEKGQPFDQVMRIMYPDKEKCRWIHAISYPVHAEYENSIYFNGIIIDITQRKLAEEKLVQSEKEIRKALSEVERSEFLLNEAGRIAKIGAWEFDTVTQKTRWSKEVFNLHAIPVGEVPEFDYIMGCYVDGSEEILRKSIEECITERKIYELELRFLNARNEKLWVHAIGYPIINDKDEIISLRGVVQDITQQKKAEIELQESEEKFRLIAENSKDVISLHDSTGKYLYISPSIKNIRGYSPSELIGKNPYDFIHPDDIPLITTEDNVKKLLQGKSILVVYRYKSKSGKFGWFESYRQPIFNDKNEIIKILSVSRDISERKEREIEIENYQKKLQNLTTEISLIEEKQRKEIAENIHDHLSQSLVISKMKLNDLQKELKNPVSKGELKLVIDHISNALENSRKITYDLSPPVLYELGLIETLYWFVEKIEEEHNLKASFSTNMDNLNLPEQKLILLFRIVQELVNNTIKHALAKKIEITLAKEKEGMQFRISDDGKGFDIKDLNKIRIGNTGFGLFAVRERVQNLGGEFSISSKIGTGTEIKIYIPLQTI